MLIKLCLYFQVIIIIINYMTNNNDENIEMNMIMVTMAN